MLDVLKHIKIAGISCCVPEAVMESEELIPYLGEREVKKFKRVTGVKQRHVSPSDRVMTAGDLCHAAAENLLKELETDRDTIDAVILVTQSSDYLLPSTACILQERLRLREETIAYDVSLGCSGYIYGLHLAASYLQSGCLKRILLLAGEADVHPIPVTRRIFGEAGSATLVEYDSEYGAEMDFSLKTIGRQFRSILEPYGRFRHGMDPKIRRGAPLEQCFGNRMDGIEVFKFAVHEVPKLTKEYLELTGKPADFFDLFVYHQSNKMILKEIVRKVGIPEEKCPISLDFYGNTNSASIPLAICDYFNRLHPQEKSEREKKILACGYGIGLSLGVTAFSISGNRCLPVITAGQPWEDGILV